MSLPTRSVLENEIDDAIRKGIVRAGGGVRLYEFVGEILPEVMRALKAHEPTAEEVAAHIREAGGFMRSGDDAVLPDGRHAGPRVLTDALMLIWREDQS